MYFNEVSDYLTDLSLSKKLRRYIPSNSTVRLPVIFDSIMTQTDAKITADKPRDIPNYIDPNTGKSYDPFREDSERGRRLHHLRKLRAVLP